MSGVWAALLLVAGALVVLWPVGSAARRRLPLAGGDLPKSRIAVRKVWQTIGRRPRRAVPAAVAGVAVVALLVGGPVAGAVAAIYAALGGRAFLRRAARKQAATARAAALDDLVALAADLRAGLPPAAAGRLVPTPLVAAEGLGPTLPAAAGRFGPALPAAAGRFGAALPAAAGGLSLSPADRLARLTGSVWRLAERTGAPAADLVERIEADARAADRATAKAAAQSAGAQATALLLAALPLGGIGLGIAIGADPVRVLLHTPLGAACALGAVLLQCGGLFWADRLTTGVTR